jgi:hypothetical protein
MKHLGLVCLVLVASVGAAHAQPMPPGPPPTYYPPPPPPNYYPPPPPNYYPPPSPVYAEPYAPNYGRPSNSFLYARKARIFRGIGIPLLAVGVPMAVAGGIVWIVGAACDSCSSTVTNTGIGLFAGGLGLIIPGAILTGMGGYYRWMSLVASRMSFGFAFARDRGGATLRVRF